MKESTLKKANELKERLDNIQFDVSYSTELRNGENSKPEDVLRRSYDIMLNESDAEKLHAHIQRFVVNLRKQLKSEFDSLK